MKTNEVMNLAIEQYANMINASVEEVRQDIANKDEVVINSLYKIMCIVAIESGNAEQFLEV
jgi:hypothetical protein